MEGWVVAGLIILEIIWWLGLGSIVYMLRNKFRRKK